MWTQLLAPLCGPDLMLDRSVVQAAPVCVTVVTTCRPDLQVQKAGLCSAFPRGQPGLEGVGCCVMFYFIKINYESLSVALACLLSAAWELLFIFSLFLLWPLCKS